MINLFPGEELAGTCARGHGVYLVPRDDGWRIRHECHGWLFKGVHTKDTASMFAKVWLTFSNG